MARYLAMMLIAMAAGCSRLDAQWITVSTGSDEPRHVLLEEFTGTWVGLAPEAGLSMDAVSESIPTTTIVSIHAASMHEPQTALQTDEGTALARDLVPGYPLGIVDRATDGLSQSFWYMYVDQRRNMEPQVDLSISARLDGEAHTIETTVQVKFRPILSPPPGRYRLHLYLVEDSVVGSGPGYDQKSDFNDAVGSPFQGAGDTLKGYVHRHVLRRMVTGLDGDSAVIPRAPVEGLVCNASYAFPLLPGMNAGRTSLVAFVEHRDVPEVLNSLELRFGAAGAGVASAVAGDAGSGVAFFPQPARGQVTARFHLELPGTARIELFDPLGRSVRSVETEVPGSGSHLLPIDVAGLSAGIYLARIDAPGVHEVRRVPVAR